MAKFRIKYTRVRWCGAEIVSPGMHQYFPEAENVWSTERSYNTETVPLVGHSVAMLDNSGNLSGNREITVLVDYESPEEAIADAMRRRAFCDEHQRGTLREETGSRVQESAAGLQGFTATLSIPFNGARMEYTYTFALGALPSYFDPERPDTDTPLHPFPVAPEPTRNASISVMIIPQGGTIPPEFAIHADGALVVESYWNQALTYDNLASWVEFLNSGAPGSLQGVARATLDAELLTLEAIGDWAGARGNRLTLETYAPSPWEYIPDPHFSGGEG